MHVVIRAGGLGTRLWPLSRKSYPKQFHPLIENRSMVKLTYDRLAHIANQNEIFVSVNATHTGLLFKDIPSISDSHVIIEPVSKNTGPAVCLEACYLERAGLRDAIVASIPSDDHITDEKAFCSMLKASHAFVDEHSNLIITPGAIPTRIDVGYSYLRMGRTLYNENGYKVYHVDEWVEKPPRAQCRALIESRKYIAHTGMYVWKIETILEKFHLYCPEMLDICRRVVATSDKERAKQLYDQLPKESIEQCLISKLDNVAMIGSEKMGWSDVGKWHVLSDVLEKDHHENVCQGDVMCVDSTRNMIRSNGKTMIALVDVHDLVVVQTDDVIFIAPKKQSDRVKDIQEILKEQNKETYL